MDSIPVYGLSGVNGVFDVNFTPAKRAEVQRKKTAILIRLRDTDDKAFRIAKVIMPYAVDIDERDGGYLFPSLELAKTAATGEEKLLNYINTPGATEQGFEEGLGSLKSWLKKAWKVTVNATKAIGKAVVNSVVQPIKQTYNATKATVQLVTGDAKGALNTVKKTVTEPLTVAWDDIKNVTQATIVDPTKFAYDLTKETIKIGAKVFKVLFIKINPLTVAIRSALRGLINLNFLGMATRLSVGYMTAAEAAALGYDAEAYNKAKKAVERTEKIFKKMGGNVSKLRKSINKGASKKPLFKKDLTANTQLDIPNNADDDGDSSLGDFVAIATAIALCLSILKKIWDWIKEIVTDRKAKKAEEEKAAQNEKNRQLQEQRQAEERKLRDTYAFDENGLFYYDENYSPAVGGNSGTALAYAYATKKHKKIINVFDINTRL